MNIMALLRVEEPKYRNVFFVVRGTPGVRSSRRHPRERDGTAKSGRLPVER